MCQPERYSCFKASGTDKESNRKKNGHFGLLQLRYVNMRGFSFLRFFFNFLNGFHHDDNTLNSVEWRNSLTQKPSMVDWMIDDVCHVIESYSCLHSWPRIPIEVTVFCDLTSCSFVHRYRHFGGIALSWYLSIRLHGITCHKNHRREKLKSLSAHKFELKMFNFLFTVNCLFVFLCFQFLFSLLSPPHLFVSVCYVPYFQLLLTSWLCGPIRTGLHCCRCPLFRVTCICSYNRIYPIMSGVCHKELLCLIPQKKLVTII
jgi:hypothetical protein